MATINGKKVNVSFEGVNGYSLENLSFHNIIEVREKIAAAQKAVRDLLDLTNGENSKLMNDIFNNAYAFDEFIGKFVNDLPTECRYGDGRVEQVDFSDVPFIRVMDDNYSVKCFTVAA